MRASAVAQSSNAHVQAQAGPVGGILGERVSLLVANHLQRVFRLAEHKVRVGQPRNLLARQELRSDQHRHHFEQRRILQPTVAAAAHQLHRLHDELDLPDAAHAELEILLEIAALPLRAR